MKERKETQRGKEEHSEAQGSMKDPEKKGEGDKEGEYKEGEQMLEVPGVARQETCAYSQPSRAHPIAPLWPPLTHAWAICCALAHATLPE